MQRISMAAAAGSLALLAVMAFGTNAARAYEAPWCAVIDTGTGNDYWDCQYSSIEACRPHILSGNRGFCNPNPRYRGVEQRRYKARRHYRYRG